MGRASKEKGSRGELELAKLLSESLGVPVERNLEQVRNGGGDIILWPWLFEVKRCQKLSRPAWWKQASKAAEAAGCVPVVAYRRNREPWSFLVEEGQGYRECAFDELMKKMKVVYGKKDKADRDERGAHDNSDRVRKTGPIDGEVAEGGDLETLSLKKAAAVGR